MGSLRDGEIRHLPRVGGLWFDGMLHVKKSDGMQPVVGQFSREKGVYDAHGILVADLQRQPDAAYFGVEDEDGAGSASVLGELEDEVNFLGRIFKKGSGQIVDEDKAATARRSRSRIAGGSGSGVRYDDTMRDGFEFLGSDAQRFGNFCDARFQCRLSRVERQLLDGKVTLFSQAAGGRPVNRKAAVPHLGKSWHGTEPFISRPSGI